MVWFLFLCFSIFVLRFDFSVSFWAFRSNLLSAFHFSFSRAYKSCRECGVENATKFEVESKRGLGYWKKDQTWTKPWFFEGQFWWINRLASRLRNFALFENRMMMLVSLWSCLNRFKDAQSLQICISLCLRYFSSSTLCLRRKRLWGL